MSKQRSELEMFMRKVSDACGFNFRFHKYMSGKPRRWTFEWWKRIPGNPLNKDHILDYNRGWPIPVGSFQQCKRRKKYVEQHPDVAPHLFHAYGHLPEDGMLKSSELNVDELRSLSSNASKDEAIEHVLLKTNFLQDLLGYSISSYEAVLLA